MDEETTTNAPVDTGATIQGVSVDDQGMALPATTEPATAESTSTGETATEATSQEQTTTQETKPSDDELLDSWAKNKGLELDSDNARKAAKIARDNELAYKQKAQRTSELEKAVMPRSDQVADATAAATGQDANVLRRLQRVEVAEGVRAFFAENPEAQALEADMAAIVAERPHLAGDLDALYAMAEKKNMASVKTQTRRDTLESLAHTQTAAVPRGNAVNNSTAGTQRITPQNVNELVGKNDLAWFEKNRNAINEAMAG